MGCICLDKDAVYDVPNNSLPSFSLHRFFSQVILHSAVYVLVPYPFSIKTSSHLVQFHLSLHVIKSIKKIHTEISVHLPVGDVEVLFDTPVAVDAVKNIPLSAGPDVELYIQPEAENE